MARSLQWRHKSPEAVLARSEEALGRTLYIVHQAGPTSFVLKEEETRERKFKTCLGNPHQCSCGVFRREGELCVHILWLLLKKFKIPRESSLSFQLGLVEREINEILYRNHTHQKQPQQESAKTDQSNHVVRRRITSEDICPICQEEFSVRPLAIAYCKLGCGQNIHVRCMKIWADHQVTSGADSTVRCPVCRTNFLPLKELCGDDLCVYKPINSVATEAASSTKGDSRRDGGRRKKAKVLISRLKAYPVGAGERGGGGGGGGECEMCGEEFIRGDWVRKLPGCRHKFHRDCIDGWFKSGHSVCPIDASSISPPPPTTKLKMAQRGDKEGRRERTSDSLTLSGHSIRLPHIERGSSSGVAITTVKSIRHSTKRHFQESLERSHDQLQQSRDRSHYPLLLPPLHLPLPPKFNSHPRHYLTHQKKWPMSSGIRKGLPSSSLTLTASSARATQTTGLEVTSLRLCPLSLTTLSQTRQTHLK